MTALKSPKSTASSSTSNPPPKHGPSPRTTAITSFPRPWSPRTAPAIPCPSPMSTALTPKQLYDRDGFVVIEDFLSVAEVAELQGQLERYIRDRVPALPGTHAFYQD